MPQQALTMPNSLNACHEGEAASTVTVGCSPSPMKVRSMEVIPGVDDGATDRLDADPVAEPPEHAAATSSAAATSNQIPVRRSEFVFILDPPVCRVVPRRAVGCSGSGSTAAWVPRYEQRSLVLPGLDRGIVQQQAVLPRSEISEP